MLIQIEDLHTMLPYCGVYLENVVVTASGGYLKFNVSGGKITKYQLI